MGGATLSLGELITKLLVPVEDPTKFLPVVSAGIDWATYILIGLLILDILGRLVHRFPQKMLGWGSPKEIIEEKRKYHRKK